MNQISKVNPWLAKPLTEASKNRHFRAVMDLSAERVILGRSAIVTGWIVGGIGITCIGASIFGWVTILPLKTTEVRFFLADQSTGIISEPVSLADAPRIFGAAVEQQYLRQYVMARERWVPEMDQENDYVAKLMSSPEEQARIAEGRKSPTSNGVAIGKAGQVMIENLRFHPLTVAKDTETRRYLVQFDRTVWHGATKDPTRPWSVTVDFQWHPSDKMLLADRAINAGGMQVISYSLASDLPDGKKQ